MVWSDPDEIVGWQIVPKGLGYLFGEDISYKFNYVNNLKMIVRAHQLKMEVKIFLSRVIRFSTAKMSALYFRPPTTATGVKIWQLSWMLTRISIKHISNTNMHLIKDL